MRGTIMIIEVSKDEIYEGDTSNNNCINLHMIDSNVGSQRINIEKTIMDRLNIQIALSEFFQFNKQETDQESNSFSTVIGFMENIDCETQMKEICCFFNKVFLYKRDGKTIACQVLEPLEGVWPAFHDLKNTSKLNSWVHRFFLQDYTSEKEKLGFFKLVPKDKLCSEEYRSVLDNSFFRYVFLNERNVVYKRYIPVSGLTFREIEEDVLINSIASKKDTYLHVFEKDVQNSKIQKKHIFWKD